MSRSVVRLRVLSRTNLAYRSRHSSPKSRPFNLLRPLPSLFVAPVLCFQQLAASFGKTPGWGVHTLCGNPCLPSLSRASRGASKGAHFATGCKYTEPGILTTFRINTCKSVSKQRTLTLSRMNTYKKPGEGVPLRSIKHQATEPSAPRSASIPCGLIRLRILPVNVGVCSLQHQASSIQPPETSCAIEGSFRVASMLA